VLVTDRYLVVLPPEPGGPQSEAPSEFPPEAATFSSAALRTQQSQRRTPQALLLEGLFRGPPPGLAGRGEGVAGPIVPEMPAGFIVPTEP